MRHLQRTFSPVTRSFSSGPLRLSNPALAQQPSDIMVRKEKRSESSPDVDKNVTESESLPPLSMKDFQVFNRMAVQMDQFHNHFRLTWNHLQNACDMTQRHPPRGNNHTKQLILTGLSFCSQLDHHHSIEEKHIFPVLAKKMPEFRRQLTLLQQHKQIHNGLSKLEAYLEDCRAGETDLERGEMKRLMDAFGDVLWKHLDEEVYTLRADNMRRFWSLKEMPGLPM